MADSLVNCEPMISIQSFKLCILNKVERRRDYWFYIIQNLKTHSNDETRLKDFKSYACSKTTKTTKRISCLFAFDYNLCQLFVCICLQFK